MKKNIAVVGCGHWGKNLVRNFHELGALYAICDPNSSIADLFSSKYDVANLSFEEILEDPLIEGVVLAVPAPLHAEMGLNVIKSKKNVYIEKPLAMNKNEAQKLIDFSKNFNVRLMVGHLLQYHPAFIKLKELVESSYFGEISYIYSNRLSFGQVRVEEDVLWSFAPHDISMVLSLMKEDPHEVYTKSCHTLLDKSTYDSSIIHLNFKNNKFAHIYVSWLHPYKEHKLILVGEESMAVFDDTKSWDQKLTVYDNNVTFENGIPNLEKANPKFIELIESEPLKNECMHFISVVNDNIKPLTDGNEGMRVVNVLSAATESQVSQKKVSL